MPFSGLHSKARRDLRTILHTYGDLDAHVLVQSVLEIWHSYMHDPTPIWNTLLEPAPTAYYLAHPRNRSGGLKFSNRIDLPKLDVSAEISNNPPYLMQVMSETIGHPAAQVIIN